MKEVKGVGWFGCCVGDIGGLGIEEWCDLRSVVKC